MYKCPRAQRLTQLPDGGGGEREFKNITFIAGATGNFRFVLPARKVAEPKAPVESSLRLHQLGKSAINQPPREAYSASKLTDNYQAKKARFLVIQSLQM